MCEIWRPAAAGEAPAPPTASGRRASQAGRTRGPPCPCSASQVCTVSRHEPLRGAPCALCCRLTQSFQVVMDAATAQSLRFRAPLPKLLYYVLILTLFAVGNTQQSLLCSRIPIVRIHHIYHFAENMFHSLLMINAVQIFFSQRQYATAIKLFSKHTHRIYLYTSK